MVFDEINKLSEAIKTGGFVFPKNDLLGNGLTYDNIHEKIPPVIPTVEVKEGIVTQKLREVIENQQAQLQAIQQQKEELEKQRDQARESARKARRLSVASILVAVASFLYKALPDFLAWLGPLISGG